MYKVDLRDVLAGGGLFVFGGVSAYTSASYGIGTVRSMQAGFFPLLLSVILVVFGIILMVPAMLRAGTKIEVQWRNLVVVLAGVVFFGAALRPLGILITVFGTVAIASFATAMTLKQTVICGICVTFGIWLIFILGLGMTIPLTPWSY